MTDQAKITLSPFQSINVQKTDTGWEISIHNRPGETGVTLIMDGRAKTFDEIVEKIKQHVEVY